MTLHKNDIDNIYPHALVSEYFVWKDSLCILQTSELDVLGEFIETHEDMIDEYEFMHITTSVSYMDEEEIGYIRDYV